MNVGVVFPQNEIGADPVVLRDWVQTAEALGYSHVLAFDHVLGAERSDREPPLWGPYSEADAFHEPLTLFAHFAACTTRLTLVTGVLVLPQRQTALVAKQAAEVAILSGGRLRLGVGVGWNPVEYEALGACFHDRGRRQEEQIAVLRALWGEGVVSIDGAHHRIDRAGIAPRPPQPIPIWLGGFADAALERAARIADGFIFSRSPGREGGASRTAQLGQQLRRRVEDLGRDPGSFGLEGRLTHGMDQDATRDEIASLRAAGFDHAAVDVQRSGLADPRAHIAALERYAELAGITS